MLQANLPINFPSFLLSASFVHDSRGGKCKPDWQTDWGEGGGGEREEPRNQLCEIDMCLMRCPPHTA